MRFGRRTRNWAAAGRRLLGERRENGTMTAEDEADFEFAEADAARPAAEEPPIAGDPTQRLLTALGRFQRQVSRAEQGAPQEDWCEECMQQLIAGIELALREDWDDIKDALTDTARILQSYEDADRADEAVPYLQDSYELLCLMVGDLIVDNVRSGVKVKWRERYDQAVEDLHRAGLTLVDDEEGDDADYAPPPPRPAQPAAPARTVAAPAASPYELDVDAPERHEAPHWEDDAFEAGPAPGQDDTAGAEAEAPFDPYEEDDADEAGDAYDYDDEGGDDEDADNMVYPSLEEEMAQRRPVTNDTYDNGHDDSDFDSERDATANVAAGWDTDRVEDATGAAHYDEPADDPDDDANTDADDTEPTRQESIGFTPESADEDDVHDDSEELRAQDWATHDAAADFENAAATAAEAEDADDSADFENDAAGDPDMTEASVSPEAPEPWSEPALQEVQEAEEAETVGEASAALEDEDDASGIGDAAPDWHLVAEPYEGAPLEELDLQGRMREEAEAEVTAGTPQADEALEAPAPDAIEAVQEEAAAFEDALEEVASEPEPAEAAHDETYTEAASDATLEQAADREAEPEAHAEPEPEPEDEPEAEPDPDSPEGIWRSIQQAMASGNMSDAKRLTLQFAANMAQVEVDKAQARLRETEDRLIEDDEAIGAAERGVEEARARLQDHERQLEERREAVARHHEALNGLRGDVGDAEAAVDDLDRQIAELQERRREAVARVEQAREAVTANEADHGRLDSEVAGLQDEEARAREAVEAAEADVARLQQQRGDHERVVEEARAELESQEASANEIGHTLSRGSKPGDAAGAPDTTAKQLF